jgi:hypothetical protein
VDVRVTGIVPEGADELLELARDDALVAGLTMLAEVRVPSTVPSSTQVGARPAGSVKGAAVWQSQTMMPPFVRLFPKWMWAWVTGVSAYRTGKRASGRDASRTV